ncbi:MAG TPA: hypothetical protein VK997_11860 [Deferrisomatales bacterium]|nr:hypothetical protein [Deferrisomatales bacterium]
MPAAAAPPAPFGTGRVFRFWVPLAATWLMMAVEGPFLAALIARLAEPQYNLAAFGVALSFALLLEAPVIMIMAAATALVRDRDSLRRLRRFTYSLNAALTVATAALLAPPVFDAVAGSLMGLPPPVAHLTYGSLALLLPWPAAIGYRRLYQGVLIRHGLTRRVGLGTVVRLAGMSITAVTLFRLGIAGAYLAAASLSTGVLVEALASRWMCAGALRELGKLRGRQNLSYPAIAGFYYPLALSSVLTLGVHPIISYFLAQGQAAVESLAVFPVVRSLVFLFSCLGLSYQEVGIALLGERAEGYAPLRRFALGLGLVTALGLAGIAFSPLGDVWYRQVSGLPVELAAFCPLPTRILALVPLLSVYLSFQRSVYMAARRTGSVTAATAVDVGAIIAVLYLGTRFLEVPGIQVAAVALVAGRSAGSLWLRLPRAAMLRGLVDSRGSGGLRSVKRKT